MKKKKIEIGKCAFMYWEYVPYFTILYNVKNNKTILLFFNYAQLKCLFFFFLLLSVDAEEEVVYSDVRVKQQTKKTTTTSLQNAN